MKNRLYDNPHGLKFDPVRIGPHYFVFSLLGSPRCTQCGAPQDAEVHVTAFSATLERLSAHMAAADVSTKVLG